MEVQDQQGRADHPPPSGANIQNAWSLIPCPLFSFMALSLGTGQQPLLLLLYNFSSGKITSLNTTNQDNPQLKLLHVVKTHERDAKLDC
jgi:hypothetical protein